MKKGLISIGILSVFLLSVLVVSGVFAQTAKDDYAIDNSFGQVKFGHKKHVDLKFECVKCHHELKGKKPGEAPKACNTCHKEKAEGKTPSAKDAYHKDCRSCHEEASKSKKPAGPTACNKCHDTKIKKK
jgi:hypothetical protein